MKTNSLFYKFLLIMTFAIFSTAKAQTVNTEWATKINQTFIGIDKNKVPHSLLKDYAMEFTNLAAYNGVLTDTTFIDANIMGDIYKTIFMSKVVADTVTSPLFDRYAYNWTKARFKATKVSSSVYILSGLLYEYQLQKEKC